MNEGPSTSDPGQQPAQPAVPAGWYPHPTAPGWEAYWDGTGWGPDTRPAPAPAVPSGAQEQAAAREPAVAGDPATVSGEQAVADQQPAAVPEPVPAEEPVVAEPTPVPAEEPVVAEPTPAVAAEPAAVPAAEPATEQQQTAGTGGPPGAPATAAAAAPAVALPATAAATGTAARSDSAFPVILCVLGALVAIVGSFLPEAKLELNGTALDLVDNTMVAAGYGIAVIAAAVLGAGIAAWAYLKANRTWLPVLLGAIIVAIAVYAGTAGLDATPDFGGGLTEIPGLDDNGSPSTGIFAVGVGGLMMLLGGIGLARENR